MKKFTILSIFIILLLTLVGCQKTDDLFRLYFGDSKDSITRNITLFQSKDGHQILWESSDENVITSKGVVTRPEDKDNKVILTAHYNNIKVTYELIVKKLTNNAVLNEYPALASENHMIKKVERTSIIDIFEQKQTAFVYFGFMACSYCQEYIYFVEKEARKANVEIIYYDFSNVRLIEIVDDVASLTPEIGEIFSYIGAANLPKHTVYKHLSWLYAPTFMAVKDGKVEYLFTGNIGSHNAGERNLNKSEQKELIDIAKRIIEIVKD